jgi:hypothetical protein
LAAVGKLGHSLVGLILLEGGGGGRSFYGRHNKNAAAGAAFPAFVGERGGFKFYKVCIDTHSFRTIILNNFKLMSIFMRNVSQQ